MPGQWKPEQDKALREAVQNTPKERYRSTWWRLVAKKVGFSTETCRKHFKELGLSTPYEHDFEPRNTRKPNNPPWRVALGEVIYRRRKALDLWPEDFDVSPGTMSRIETGCDYYLSTLEKIAHGLGTTPSKLLAEAETHQISKVAAHHLSGN